MRTNTTAAITIRTVLAASLALGASFAAQADGDGVSYLPQSSVSQRSSAEVRAEAYNPVVITNGGTGYSGLAPARGAANNSATAMRADRETVRREAAVAVRSGTIPSGEKSAL